MENINQEICRVLEKYFADISCSDHNIEKIPFGICNETYRVTHKGDFFILQKLNMAIANKDLISDFCEISRKLSGRGWKVPVLIENKSDREYFAINDGMWRMYREIAGKTAHELENIDYFSIGMILQKFHGGLKAIKYNPHFKINHFHDTNFYMDRLEMIGNDLDKEMAHVASGVIKEWKKLGNVLKKQIQLIHGDPRAENYLFDDKGRAFTMIDFDTFMKGSLFIDIGDLLRSINFSANQIDYFVSEERISKVLSGYLTACRGMDEESFIEDALKAMRQIALELSARFLIDVVEDRYFGWDPISYSSRKDNNMARAFAQWNFYHDSEAVDLSDTVRSVRIKETYKFNPQ